MRTGRRCRRSSTSRSRRGVSLVVKPTWEHYDPQPGDRIIEIDPGMAFGSGTHETTSMCLELLEDAMHGGESVIDVGTGSGILAIGAAMLGAKDVLAIDIDPVAVRVAKEERRAQPPVRPRPRGGGQSAGKQRRRVRPVRGEHHRRRHLHVRAAAGGSRHPLAGCLSAPASSRNANRTW